MTKPRVLILFAHPTLERSRCNRVLLEAVRDLPGVTFNDLYQMYPDFDIDVKREQDLLLEHDVIVMQHPFYWYSSPALLKEWEDLVLEHGWAYGHEGRALHGKLLLTAITAGGGEDSYCRKGYNRFTIRELLSPIDQTAALCGMTYLAPFIVFGTHAIDAAGIAKSAFEYRRVIEALRDDRLDVDAAAGQQRLNLNLDALIRNPTEA